MNEELDYVIVGFYGVDGGPANLQRVYDALLEWFRSLQRRIDKLWVRAPGFSEKIGEFQRLHGRLEKTCFAGVSGFALHSIISNPPTIVYPSLHSSLQATVFLPQFVSIQGRPDVISLTSECLFRILSQIERELNPAYGIGLGQRRDSMLKVHMQGTSHRGTVKGAVYEEAVRQCHWGGMGIRERLFNRGIIRDVYPWNFLNSSQLGAKVEGQLLEEWIKREQGRGELTPMSDALTLWSLDDAQIARVRPVLWDAGVIFDWKKFVSK